MAALIDFLFGQYADYSTQHIILEIVAVIFGVASVYYSRANNILVYPTGIISTGIFVYLLNAWGLVGDMLVNAYYFVMSIYGWYIWTRKTSDDEFTPVRHMSRRDLLYTAALFIASIAFVYAVYVWRDKLVVEENSWIPYTDIFTTAIFFSGMYLMAKRKIEHWYFWIVANVISIPLYFIKGYTFTSIQYVIFLILAIAGIIEWRRIIKEQASK